MSWQFTKHYTLEEARELLPQIRQWLSQLSQTQKELKIFDEQMSELLARGHDLGGEVVTAWLRGLAKIKTFVDEFQTREIQLKDLERGLIDFPALIDGKEVYLCWEKCEDDIRFWHDLDAGYAGREPLT
jgi:hypothetical protein